MRVHYHVPIGDEKNYRNYRFELVAITYDNITRWECPMCWEYLWHDASKGLTWRS